MICLVTSVDDRDLSLGGCGDRNLCKPLLPTAAVQIQCGTCSSVVNGVRCSPLDRAQRLGRLSRIESHLSVPLGSKKSHWRTDCGRLEVHSTGVCTAGGRVCDTLAHATKGLFRAMC